MCPWFSSHIRKEKNFFITTQIFLIFFLFIFFPFNFPQTKHWKESYFLKFFCFFLIFPDSNTILIFFHFSYNDCIELPFITITECEGGNLYLGLNMKWTPKKRHPKKAWKKGKRETLICLRFSLSRYRIPLSL